MIMPDHPSVITVWIGVPMLSGNCSSSTNSGTMGKNGPKNIINPLSVITS